MRRVQTGKDGNSWGCLRITIVAISGMHPKVDSRLTYHCHFDELYARLGEESGDRRAQKVVCNVPCTTVVCTLRGWKGASRDSGLWCTEVAASSGMRGFGCKICSGFCMCSWDLDLCY